MQQHRLSFSLASIRESKFHEFILFFYGNLHFTLNFELYDMRILGEYLAYFFLYLAYLLL